ncbi:kinase-like domain-containing protein [Thelephora terrestris]|uniref:Kinase-like domain-containing protein n=1 Tax=Thelephora terrestris TaxID=56493 RepID=A0A9P6H8A7_9AGAM|nr:kinase-like domain-containing protein [Thelephora terrestris]
MTSSASVQTTSWQTLLTLDRKSNDFTHSARRLLVEQRTREYEASQFTEEEASNLIELIEQTILKHPDIAGELKSVAFTVLRRLCGTFGMLPRSCIINEDFRAKEEAPFASRGYVDLWKLDWDGRKVAVRTLRFGPGDDRSETTMRFCKEVLLWKLLDHPNVLPFHGASMGPDQYRMVFPWMENGNVLSYTRKNPEANRLQFLVDVANGLKFLHRASLVHGNIRGSNILISDSRPPQVLLSDYGLNTIVFDASSFSRASINWTAPELLAPDNATSQPSVSSDIYSLGMVIYEVLTGAAPFERRGDIELACKVVLEDERPRRPRDSEKLGFTDEVWEVLQNCWGKEPSTRPSVDLVAVCLKQAAETWVVDVPAFMLASRAGVDQVLNLKEDQAKDFANQLDTTLDSIGISGHSGKTYLKYLQKLCDASGVLPASFMLTDGFEHIETLSFAKGGFADVYRATYKGQLVVAKTLKTSSLEDLENWHKRFAKEVVGWKWLRHENILPFVGVTSEPPPFSMVSPLIENGNIMSFIKANPDQNPFNLLVDVTNGLQYLHRHDFVHGDLKGANILINLERRACLADFGLTEIIGEVNFCDEHSDNRVGGTIRWMAPEILSPEMYGYVKCARKKLPSKSMDIYALGMTILEVISGRKPFEHTNPDAAVIQKVLGGFRPERPSVGFSDALWTLLTQTWLEEFETPESQSVRPSITDILKLLQDEADNWIQPSRPLQRVFSSSMKPNRSAASSTGSSGYASQHLCRTEDNTGQAPPRGQTVDVEILLKNLDNLIGPAPTDDPSSFPQNFEHEEQPGQVPEQSQARSSLHIYIPSSPPPPPPPPPLPRVPSVLPRTRKQGPVGRAWDKLKKSFMEKFLNRAKQCLSFRTS